jgi:colanic acid/amylovoran biosynthesis glycosyltransferase
MGEGVLIVALCGAEQRASSVVLERKFHDGTMGMVERLNAPIVCLLPRLTPAESRDSMDAIEVPLAQLPYRIDFMPNPFASNDYLDIIENSLDGIALVVMGAFERLSWALASSCRRRGIPYVIVSECTQNTNLQIMRTSTPSLVRRVVREMKIRLRARRTLGMIAGAAEVHANGYPTYEELAATNPRRMLFFDTRAKAADIVSRAELRQRLAMRTGRRPRLIFSGRYHPIKGALDVINVGVELERRGFDFQLDLYGKGLLKEKMEALVRASGTESKITIHDPIPFPELQKTTRQADLFVCCHVQGDPSCTYLETFGCGVPIAGYANEMWLPLCRESGAGAVARAGDYKALADTVIQLLEGAAFDDASHRALDFAARHTMEVALDSRTSRMAALIKRNTVHSFAFESRSAIT